MCRCIARPRGQSSVLFFFDVHAFLGPVNQSLRLYILPLLRGRHSAIFISKARWFRQPNHSPQLFSCYKGLDVTQLPSTKFWEKLSFLIIGPENTNWILQCIGLLAPQCQTKLEESCHYIWCSIEIWTNWLSPVSFNSGTLQKSDHY